MKLIHVVHVYSKIKYDKQIQHNTRTYTHKRAHTHARTHIYTHVYIYIIYKHSQSPHNSAWTSLCTHDNNLYIVM